MLIVPSNKVSEVEIKKSPHKQYLISNESSSVCNLPHSIDHPLIDESHLESDIKRELAFTIEDLGSSHSHINESSIQADTVGFFTNLQIIDSKKSMLGPDVNMYDRAASRSKLQLNNET